MLGLRTKLQSEATISTSRLSKLFNITFIIQCMVVCALVFLIVLSTKIGATSWKTTLDGTIGDCEAIGRQRPPWDDRIAFINALPAFQRLYEERPFKDNGGGMRFDHSFGLWYILSSMNPKPDFVIESGAHRGHSTWLITHTLPNARVISLSPSAPELKFKNVSYFNNDNFEDFGKVNWKSIGVDPSRSVVLIDDHQSAYRRIFDEGRPSGFRRFIQDDNYGYQRGDNLNMRWACEVSRKSEWKGVIHDNFGKIKTKQTWEGHMQQVNVLRRTMKYYYEFPPIASTKITNSTSYVEELAVPPLISDPMLFEMVLGNLNIAELRNYCHMCYVELV